MAAAARASGSRSIAMWVVRLVFAVLLAFPFYWMLITTFKRTTDLYNLKNNPFIFNERADARAPAGFSSTRRSSSRWIGNTALRGPHRRHHHAPARGARGLRAGAADGPLGRRARHRRSSSRTSSRRRCSSSRSRASWRCSACRTRSGRSSSSTRASRSRSRRGC